MVLQALWPTDTVEEAHKQYFKARDEYHDILDQTVLAGVDYGDLSQQYDCYLNGRTYNYLPVDDDELRKFIEFAPLRDECPDPKDVPLSRFQLNREEMGGMIRLMKRVLDGELGGPGDGA